MGGKHPPPPPPSAYRAKKHFNKPLVMTEVDEQQFKGMDGCHICGEKYTDKDVRIRDHCQITGNSEAQLIKSVT